MQKTYCSTKELLNVFANVYYLKKDKMFYLKGVRQNYFRVKDLNISDFSDLTNI